MRDVVHHPEITALISEIASRWPPRRHPNAYWIAGPAEDYGDWCRSCGMFKLRNVRRRDRKRRDEYLLDGGWRTEHDHRLFCSGCHVKLDGSLTTYGVEAELEHFTYYGVRPGSAGDADDLLEVLEALEWTDVKHADMAAEAQACAEALLWAAT